MGKNQRLKVHRQWLPGRSLCSIRSNRKWCKRRGSSLECQNCFFVYPIIDSNLKNLLSGCLPSYDGQIKKAYIRKDHNSINHRVTEFLASYFDVIFAVNELTHPGEKRLVQLCREQCGILPEHFEENMEKLFAAMFQGNVCEVIDEMVREIKKIEKTIKIY